MLGQFRDLRCDLGLLRRFEMILVEFLTGGGADPVEPFVIGDRIATERALLVPLDFLLLVDLRRGNLVRCRYRRLHGGVSGGIQILLEPITSLAAIQIALPDGDSLEGLAALEGGLIAILLAAHEPPQILEGEGPHGAARPTSPRGSRIAYGFTLPRGNGYVHAVKINGCICER